MLDIILNAPHEIKLRSVTLKVSNLKLREIAALSRWIKQNVPRPSDEAKKKFEGLSQEERNALWRDALKEDADWPPDPSSWAGQRAIQGSEEGVRCFLKLLVAKNEPTVTDAQIEELFGVLAEEEFELLWRIAFGDNELDPKVMAEAIATRLRANREKSLLLLTGEGLSTPSPSPETE